jgi:hypothetical protein
MPGLLFSGVECTLTFNWLSCLLFEHEGFQDFIFVEVNGPVLNPFLNADFQALAEFQGGSRFPPAKMDAPFSSSGLQLSLAV